MTKSKLAQQAFELGFLSPEELARVTGKPVMDAWWIEHLQRKAKIAS
jgi:hypothetical protein